MKTIKVRVYTNSKKPRVEPCDGYYKVYIAEKPVSGKANQALIKSLAHYFGIRPSSISIAIGGRSREKVIKIIE